ncbi:unnamed protein product [Orchesella dallaii]|uniref:Uncharacterized protein n=1 Tax=Orchesella dallaii TaxID=48710 RepID=A0ABP1PW67_9HEXA
MEARAAMIPDVSFNSIRPDVLCQVYRSKLEEFGYLKANVVGIPRTRFTWEELYQDQKDKKHRLYGVDRLVEDVLAVSTKEFKSKWRRVKGSVTIDEAVEKLNKLSTGSAGPYEVVYVILEDTGNVKCLQHFKLEDSFENLKSVMHTAMKKNNWKKGVQTLYVYAGQCMTVFPIHTEDNKFESINVNIFGADKCWDIVPPKYSDDVRRACEVLKSNLQLHSSENLCNDFLQHKRLLLTDNFFHKNGIEIFRVRQPAGTVKIIGPDVYHQGVNLGDNVAIAINFSSVVWHASIYQERRFLLDNQCKCIGVSARFTNQQTDAIAKLHELINNYASHLPLHESSSTKPISNSNRSVTNSNQKNYNKVCPFVCTICNITFTKKFNLQRHKSSVHTSSASSIKFTCHSCQLSFSNKGNLSKHLRNNTCK